MAVRVDGEELIRSAALIVEGQFPDDAVVVEAGIRATSIDTSGAFARPRRAMARLRRLGNARSIIARGTRYNTGAEEARQVLSPLFRFLRVSPAVAC